MLWNCIVFIFKHPVLHIATRLFVEKSFGIKEEYNKNALTYFKAESESVNFKDKAAAKSLINGWVEKKTNNKIKDLITDGK